MPGTFVGTEALCCWVPRVDRDRTTGGFGPEDIYTRERWEASQEARDMSELCLGVAL